MRIPDAPVIEIRGLRKAFRGRRGTRMALDGLDLVVESGQVHGFLGPNGSGKTTTLRALLGLVGADGGAMRLFGHPVPAALPVVIGMVGAVVESPRFFGNFTARRTLRLLATAGGVERRRVDEVLEAVGLRDRARERVRSYSLGMKQRLAVASALLKSPRLLILDEPANGLDPAGIREMRDLLRGLGQQGVTVLLSSHILSEVQQICDHVTIISMGRRVVAGPVGEVLSRFSRGDIRLKVADLDAAARVISAAGFPVGVYHDHMVVSNVEEASRITETLARHGLYVSELTPLVPNLENVFLNLTGTAPAADGPRQIDDAYRPPLDQRGGTSEPEAAPGPGQAREAAPASTEAAPASTEAAASERAPEQSPAAHASTREEPEDTREEPEESPPEHLSAPDEPEDKPQEPPPGATPAEQTGRSGGEVSR